MILGFVGNQDAIYATIAARNEDVKNYEETLAKLREDRQNFDE